jgi:HlyD family secretion protein
MIPAQSEDTSQSNTTLLQRVAGQKKFLLLIAIVLICIIITVMNIRPAKITAYSVKKQDYIPSLLLSGEVIADSKITLSVQTSGIVTNLSVSKGMTVQKGQLLLQLDDRQARTAVEHAQSSVQQARLNLQQAETVNFENARATSEQMNIKLEQAQKHYEQTKILQGNGIASLQELTDAESELKLAQQQADAAKVALEALRDNGVTLAVLQQDLQQRQLELQDKELLLEQCQIKAPCDGQILELNLHQGEQVLPGNNVAIIAAGNQTRIQIKPDQRYAPLAALNSSAQVWLTTNAAQKWSAKVTNIDPTGNSEQGSLTAELTLEENISALYPGCLVSVQIFGAKQENAIIIPDTYLSTQNGNTGAWIAKNNRAHFVVLQLGLRTPEGVLVNSGLQEEDILLIPGSLKENQKISPQSQG